MSLTALFSAKPFYPGKKLNQQTVMNHFIFLYFLMFFFLNIINRIIITQGKLEVDMNSKKLTYISRLSAIWSHVSKSINKFEETPDRG